MLHLAQTRRWFLWWGVISIHWFIDPEYPRELHETTWYERPGVRYHKSQLTGTGSKVPPDLLSMLWGPLLLWKVHNRSCKWSLLFSVEEEVEKGKNSGAGILYPHSYRVKSEIHSHSGRRAAFGLCKFWAKVAFWSNGRTNGRSVKCQRYRSSRIKVQELSAAGQWNGSKRWMEWIIKLQRLGERLQHLK